jgi:uncharacterized protein (DUF736 family)
MPENSRSERRTSATDGEIRTLSVIVACQIVSHARQNDVLNETRFRVMIVVGAEEIALAVKGHTAVIAAVWDIISAATRSSR